VWYPEGSKEIETILETFRRCYRGTIPFQVIAHPLKDGETIFLGKASVLARSVKHWNSIKGRPLTPAPAMGYRVEFRGFKVAISGDTAFCPSLIELVRGTDLALIEATLNEEATNDQKTFLHLTQIKARELGQLAKQFWLIHVSM
jgi:ribonuclease BN (tRNA processing enzyme)